MDEIAAPGILAYRGGECFANLVSFLSEIPHGKDVNVQTVGSVLERYVQLKAFLRWPIASLCQATPSGSSKDRR